MAVNQSVHDKQLTYKQLQHYSAAALSRSIWLSQIIASWTAGESVLPDRMGLECPEFQRIKNNFFPNFQISETAISGKTLDFERMLEREDLINLLQRYANLQAPEYPVIIALIVAGCMGGDHLWRDLGLWSRKDLSEMLSYYFPDLAAKNTKNMKWKKFLYKQLCDEEGIYLCRAPSCEVCSDQSKCFGPEED